MTAKLRTRGTLRTPWNRTPSRRNPTPAAARENAEQAKSDLRQGGLEHDGRDPLRHVPLKEPYAARSGARPAEAGTPATVARAKRKNKES